MKSIGEFDRISRFFAPLTKNNSGAFQLTDDGGVWTPTNGYDQVVTSDCLIEGVHFFSSDKPFLLGQKLLAVNVSDLAAMGAQPQLYSLVMAYPEWVDENWMASFTDGLNVAQDRYHISLIGGDTVATPGPLTMTISAIGAVKSGQAIRRNGAKAGDDIYVSGTLGDAALALNLEPGSLSGLAPEWVDDIMHRFLCPTARIELGRALVGVATSAIDVSDGLMADLGHIARASIIHMDIRCPRLPLSLSFQRALETDPRLIDLALTGGDNYELAFTTTKKNRRRITEIGQKLGLNITRIGTCSKQSSDADPIHALTAKGKKHLISETGYRHF